MKSLFIVDGDIMPHSPIGLCGKYQNAISLVGVVGWTVFSCCANHKVSQFRNYKRSFLYYYFIIL